MRVAVFVVSILVVTTTSCAPDSCMTKDEARTSHIYWHGRNHCWDATPVHKKGKVEVAKDDDQLKWRDARSQLLPSSASLSPSSLQPSERDEAPRGAAEDAPLTERWIDIA